MSATKFLAAFAALASLAIAATPALSAPDPDQVSVKVKVGDLNLGTESGAKSALYRIRMAASGLCGGEPPLRDLSSSTRYYACVNQTVGTAVASANQPVLAAVASRYLPTTRTVLAAR